MIGVNRSTICTMLTMRQRWVIFIESSAELRRDNQLDCVVSMANVAHTQKYDIATKIGHNRPQKSIKLIVGDLECHDVACQVLPHLVFLIPTQRNIGTSKNSGEGW